VYYKEPINNGKTFPYF